LHISLYSGIITVTLSLLILLICAHNKARKTRLTKGLCIHKLKDQNEGVTHV